MAIEGVANELPAIEGVWCLSRGMVLLLIVAASVVTTRETLGVLLVAKKKEVGKKGGYENISFSG